MEKTKSASKSDESVAPPERGRGAESTEVQAVTGLAATLDIPAILLEGDNPPSQPVRGLGRRYALGPTPALEHLEHGETLDELPDSYGTQRLTLTPRDPHWVYAHWDLTREQQRHCNRISADGHLILRIRSDSLAGERVAEVHVHPESRYWFLHVGRAGRGYVAELGCTDTHGKWASLAVSGVAFTPPDAMSADTSVQFVTVPPNVPLSKRVERIEPLSVENVPRVGANLQSFSRGQLEPQGIPGLGAPSQTPEQENGLAETVSLDAICRGQMDSLGIAGFSHGEIPQELASMAAAQITPQITPPPTFSSPHGGGPRPRPFRFDVNVEIIIHGGTEPDAVMTLGGRRIQLRADGTFSCRFALPDGQYPLSAVATSADGNETRRADFQLARGTKYAGEVGAHPQDASLLPPPASA